MSEHAPTNANANADHVDHVDRNESTVQTAIAHVDGIAKPYRPLSMATPKQVQQSYPADQHSHTGSHQNFDANDTFRLVDESAHDAARSLQQFAAGLGEHACMTEVPSETPQDGHDEEAVVYTQTRMLQDPTGRVQYIGDSATLSFLQLIRMMVENASGPSPFTSDPRRHKITESNFSLPSNMPQRHLLPDVKTARILVDSFFMNTHGLLHVFERRDFMAALESCYNDPLSAQSSWLCVFNLVLAVGLMLATPRPGTNEAAVIDKLRNEQLDRTEIFYMNAKSFNDPLTGFEDADFWSVQALLLMAVYMLAKTKRNAAFTLLGMAVRSAYSMGLHREETMVIFSPEERALRRNLWRSLFVMDRFLSCSLGRPTAISEEDCSGNTLQPPDPDRDSYAFGFGTGLPTASVFTKTSVLGLEAAVRSCSVIGTILKRVYQQRRISTRLAQEIADICKLWPKALAPMLHWRQATAAPPCQGIAILHVNLLYCHSIILLTRPFFLFILNAEIQKDLARGTLGSRPARNYAQMEKFGEACVIASTHTVVLVQNTSEAGYLPRRNPVVIYFLFAAALILLSNEFASLYLNTSADQCIRNAITIMAYCAETDPLASRLLYIFSAYRDVVIQQRRRQQMRQQTQATIPSPMAVLQPIYSVKQPATGHVNTLFRPNMQQQYLHVQSQMESSQAAAPLTRSQSDPTNPIQAQSSQQQTPPAARRISFAEPHPSPQVGGEVFRTVSNGTPAAGNSTPTIHDAITSPQPMPLNSIPSLERHISLSDLLDLSSLDNTGVQGVRSEGSSAPDEQIDFDVLWNWPSNTPVAGSPHVQGVSDSAVPLFGVMDP